MDAEERRLMTQFLKANIDLFSWQPYDMSGIDERVICHKLHIDPNHKPIKKKLRKTSPEKAKAMEEEV